LTPPSADSCLETSTLCRIDLSDAPVRLVQVLRLTVERVWPFFRRVASISQSWRALEAMVRRRGREGLRVDTNGDTPPSGVFVRATPQKSSVIETYCFHQVSSVNPVLRAADEAPTGRVEVVVPLDGYRHFTRDAIKDVQGQIGKRRGRGNDSTVLATIGHLVLANLRDTRRVDEEPIADARGAIRLQVPVRSAGLGDDDLVADEQEARLRFDYRPPALGAYTVPIQLDIEILDPEDSSLLGGDFETKWGRAISDEMVRQPAFSSELLLQFRVRLAWPQRRGFRKPRMRIKNFALSWPTVTSLAPSSLRLSYGSARPAEIQYNPETGSLQWFDVPLLGEKEEPIPDAGTDPEDAEQAKVGRAVDPDDEPGKTDRSASGPVKDDDGGLDNSEPDDLDDEDDDAETESAAVWDETSEDVLLHVRQPGQLRKAKVLTGSVSVEVAGQLMSGIDARLFDATGARHRRGVLTLKTKLRLTFQIVLEDVFNRRPLSATHTLHFDEVVPDVQRVEDINAALRDRGFDVVSYPLLEDEAGLEWRIRATKPDGPDRIVLSIVVRGQRYQTTRRSGTPGWHRYTSEIDSGELRLAIHGIYPRHSRELTAEVNALRQALASRFRHMAAQR
jgi:hypothetical protein